MQAMPQSYVNDASSTTHPSTGAVERWRHWQALADRLSFVLHRPLDQSDFLGEIEANSRQLISLTRDNADLAIFHMVHATPDKIQRYSSLHAMYTAVLLALIGLRKDWGDTRTGVAVKAALTMNLSIMDLQLQLAVQSDPLSPLQRQSIEAHPLASAELLRQLGVNNEDWLQSVEQHHEQSDGRGYPRGLYEIHPLADALRTCDIFGAKISPRVGRNSIPTPRAAAEIFRQRSVGYFGATIIRELGLYPPGCLVELVSGEQAVVVQRDRNPQAPQVVILPSPSSTPAGPLRRIHSTPRGAHLIVGATQEQYWLDRATVEDVLAST
jgi:HD-GYP domain-containing protein (c-di-GMP phosphodiesterase class II)